MLTKEQIDEMFNSIDTDKNGSIDIEEFKTAFRKFFPNVPDFALEGVFRLEDSDGNGVLDYFEFINMVRFLENHPTNDPFELLFLLSDLNTDKKLDEMEFCFLWNCLYPEDDIEKVYEIFKQADKDGNHFIDYEEYKQLVETLKKELNKN